MNNESSIAAATLAGLFRQSRTNPEATQALDRVLLAKKGDNGMKAAPAASQALPAKGMQALSSKTPFMNNTSVAKKGKQEASVFPVEPRIIQTIKKPRTFVNHSYRDFSPIPAAVGETIPSDIEQMNFPQKVHHILSQPEYSKYISWQPHGRAFRINIPKMFENKVCSKYLGHTRYSSFLRQLSNHSFKNITQGPDRNCYYHECMLRGRPHLTKYMPKPKDARRLIADPVNEPDFHAISEKYPVSDTNGASASANAASTKPVAGSPRLASTLSLAGGTMPPAKRARVAVAPRVNTVSPGPAVPAQLAEREAREVMLANLRVSPGSDTSNNGREDSGVNAASLLAATYSLLSAPPGPVAPAPFPALSRLPLMLSAMSSNGVSQQVVGNTQTPTVNHAPLMQAAVDRNAVVLSALRVAMATPAANRGVPPPPPPLAPITSSNDQAISSALASLLQQVSNSQPQQQQQQQQQQQGDDLRSLLLNGRF